MNSITQSYKNRYQWIRHPWKSQPTSLFDNYLPRYFTRCNSIFNRESREIYDETRLIEQCDRVFLIDNRYSGKSTFLKHLGYKLSSEYIPFYLDLVEMSKSQYRSGEDLPLRINKIIEDYARDSKTSFYDYEVSSRSERICRAVSFRKPRAFSAGYCSPNIEFDRLENNPPSEQLTSNEQNWQSLSNTSEYDVEQYLRSNRTLLLIDNYDLVDRDFAFAQIDWLLDRAVDKIIIASRTDLSGLDRFDRFKFSTEGVVTSEEAEFSGEVGTLQLQPITKVLLKNSCKIPLFKEIISALQSENYFSFNNHYETILKVIEFKNPYPPGFDRSDLLNFILQIEQEQDYLPVLSTWQQFLKGSSKSKNAIISFIDWIENSGLVTKKNGNYYFCDRALISYLLYLAFTAQMIPIVVRENILDRSWYYLLFFVKDIESLDKINWSLQELRQEKAEQLKIILAELLEGEAIEPIRYIYMSDRNWIDNIDKINIPYNKERLKRLSGLEIEYVADYYHCLFLQQQLLSLVKLV